MSMDETAHSIKQTIKSLSTAWKTRVQARIANTREASRRTYQKRSYHAARQQPTRDEPANPFAQSVQRPADNRL